MLSVELMGPGISQVWEQMAIETKPEAEKQTGDAFPF